MSKWNTIDRNKALLHEAELESQTKLTEEYDEHDELPFFREESLNKQRQNLNHHVIAAQPITLVAISWLLVLSLTLAVFFLSSANMIEKHTVSGYLKADQPVNTVQSNTAGMINKVMVKNGQRIKQGEPLVTLQPFSPMGGDGRTNTAQLILLEEELSTLTQKNNLLNTQLHQQQQELQLKNTELLDTLTQLEQLLLLAQEKVNITQSQYLKSKQLEDKKLVSSDLTEKTKLQLLGVEEEVMRLTREITQTKHAIEKNKHQLFILETQHDLTQAELAQELTQKRSAIIMLRAKEEITYYASIDGIINGLDLSVGSEIQERNTILSIVPENAMLQGVLMIPVEKARLLALGQKVVLRYHSYPHQTFGRHNATITHIDDYFQQHNTETPMIRVDILLEKQHIGKDNSLPLLSGMTFDADVHYEEKTLLAWLLGPLIDFKGRIL